MQNEQQLLISRKIAAERLSVSVRLIDYAISRGKLKARRIGKRVLILPAELERFARQDHERFTPESKARDGR